MRKAIIENDTVVNVVEAPEDWQHPDGLETVDAPIDSGVEIGATRQPDGSFLLPEEEPEPPQPITRFTPLEFIDRLTDEEQLALAAAAMTDPAVKLWYDKLLASTFVDLSDERLPAAMAMLADAGLLTEDRAQELLSPDNTDPTGGGE